MNTKTTKIKKVLSLIAVAAVLLGLTLFGFHFSCRLKADSKGDNHVTVAQRIIVVSSFKAVQG